MYDKLEMLWAVMNVSTVDIEQFVELNQGISEQSVLVVRPPPSGASLRRRVPADVRPPLAQYAQELEKMMLLKSDFIEEFILKKREEIQAAQDALLMSADEREAFPYLWDCSCFPVLSSCATLTPVR